MFRTPGDGISVALRKLLQGGRRGTQAIYKQRLYMQQREQSVWTSKIKQQVKEFSILYIGRCKPLASRIHSFHMHLCYPVSWLTLQGGGCGEGCFLPAPSCSAITLGGGGICSSQLGEPSFSFGGQKSLMAVTFLAYWYGRRYFHFTVKGEKNNTAPQ